MRHATQRQATPALYSANGADGWSAAEILGRHKSGKIAMREVGKFWPGVWLADARQVALPMSSRKEQRR